MDIGPAPAWYAFPAEDLPKVQPLVERRGLKGEGRDKDAAAATSPRFALEGVNEPSSGTCVAALLADPHHAYAAASPHVHPDTPPSSSSPCRILMVSSSAAGTSAVAMALKASSSSLSLAPTRRRLCPRSHVRRPWPHPVIPAALRHCRLSRAGRPLDTMPDPRSVRTGKRAALAASRLLCVLDLKGLPSQGARPSLQRPPPRGGPQSRDAASEAKRLSPSRSARYLVTS